MLIEKVGTATVFSLSKEDLSMPMPTLAALEHEIRDECAQHIVADLESIHSIYSLQIGTLVAMHVTCYENVAVMKLANVNEHVKNQVKLVGLDKLMEMHHGRAVAVESFGK
jgi:anti-anti-sigma regulatory factor